MNEDIAQLIAKHRIHEVECVIPDMTGIARGKILPKDLFLSAGEMRMPKSVLLNTVNGQQPDNTPHVGDTDPDMVCRPDPTTFRIVPWAAEPVAVVIHDCFEWDGSPVRLSPRAVLRGVIDLYTKRGWRPVVAPEMEFYLVARQQNPHEPLQSPVGRTGKPEAGRQSYSIDAVNDFDPFFMELSRFCDVHRLGVETQIHEAGAGQMEINFPHGDPLELAARVFLFTRTVRETARCHGEVLIEEYVPGREVQVAILDDAVLGDVEVRPAVEFYSYEAKYQRNDTEYLCPAPISDADHLRAGEAALLAHRALGCSGYSRVDLILAPGGRLICLEVNTLPGMTEKSLLPKIAASCGIDYATLVERILDSAALHA